MEGRENVGKRCRKQRNNCREEERDQTPRDDDGEHELGPKHTSQKGTFSHISSSPSSGNGNTAESEEEDHLRLTKIQPILRRGQEADMDTTSSPAAVNFINGMLNGFSDLNAQHRNFFCSIFHLESQSSAHGLETKIGQEIIPWNGGSLTDGELVVPLQTVLPNEGSGELIIPDNGGVEGDWVQKNVGTMCHLLGMSHEDNQGQAEGMLQFFHRNMRNSGKRRVGADKGEREVRNLISYVNYEGKSGSSKEGGRGMRRRGEGGRSEIFP